ncbi:MAG: HDIG domain-containing protein [Muribaculaceae bacterium]|nr:HDIG domain-containing protein [Muribaculaceae bacterium]
MKIENRKNLLYVLLITVAGIIITFFLPGKNFNALIYEQGKPWTHPILTAPFDIPIEYDSITAQQITDSIDQNTARIYKRDNSVSTRQISHLSQVLQERGDVSNIVQRALVEEVSNLYANGIVDAETMTSVRNGDIKEMRIMANNIAEVVDPQALMSVKDAYKQLDSVLSHPYYRLALANVPVYNFLEPNLVYDSIETNKLLDDARRKALAPQGIVQTGEGIIDHGDIVTPQKYAILKTYERMMQEKEMQQGGLNLSIIGQAVFVAMMMLILFFFMKLIRPRTYNVTRKMVFIICFITVFIVVVELIVGFRYILIYAVPFALVPIIMTTFLDSRTAFFIHMIVVLLCSLVAKDQAEFIIMQFVAGNIAIVAIKEMSRRSQLLACAFFIFIAYCLLYTAMVLIRSGNLETVGWLEYVMFAFNCMVLAVAYLVIYVIERIFGFTSTVTLVELSDINTPELRMLSEACPGTFQHSLQVANLAQEAARKINANSQLARAGALYHDIGKINNPAFFTENQIGVNPHDALTYTQSARIVINHVPDGIKRAEKAKLPQVIRDFIAQHHGKGKARYFYTLACKANGNQPVDPAPFSYPGPNPQTKEAAIMMMADACEAATRSLKEPDEKAIASIVEKVINNQIVEGLLDEAPISFKDVGIIKRTFIERLRTFYHLRIAYPDDVVPPVSNDVDDPED